MQQVQKLYLCGLLSLSSFSSLAIDCTPLATWDAGGTYVANAQVKQQNKAYKANWWNQNRDPALYSNPYQEWTLLGSCDGVTQNQSPTAAITSPAASASFSAGTAVSFAANATDPDGSVAKVDFYLNNQLLSSDTSSPYQAPWTAVAGNHQLYAVAFDNQNASSQSSVVAFSVTASPGNQAPVVSLSSPANNSQYRTGETILISASASDSDGSIAKVQFYLGSTLLAEQTSAPFATSWTAVAGQQQLKVIATDNLGATSQVSALVNVTDEQSGQAACRPDGLYATPNLDVPYCTVYDSNGRELMGADHKRRIIGYFTSWRNGANGQPTYLVPNIPWSKISHINYAFAHVNASNQIGIGNTQSASNPATGMEWPAVTGAEMDPEFNYKGHFNLLNKYKKQYPHVKTLISIGGWAKTGRFL